jgi:hypothetical protein
MEQNKLLHDYKRIKYPLYTYKNSNALSTNNSKQEILNEKKVGSIGNALPTNMRNSNREPVNFQTGSLTSKKRPYNLNSTVQYTASINFLHGKELIDCRDLLVEIFGENQKMFDMDKSLQDPFIKEQKTDKKGIEKGARFFKSWYESFNPEYSNMDTLAPEKLQGFTEYKTVLAQIIRDLCIMTYIGKFNITNKVSNKNTRIKKLTKRNNNTNNTNVKKLTKYDNEECFELLKKINLCINIKNNYNYLEIFDIIVKFIILVSIEKLKIILFQKPILSLLSYLKKSPYLLYPTYNQLDFQYVVSLISCPILNFRLVNRKRLVHSSYRDALGEIAHDIFFHCDYTHLVSLFLYYNKYISYKIDYLCSLLFTNCEENNNVKTNSSIKGITNINQKFEKFTSINALLKAYFTKMTELFEILYNYYYYEHKYISEINSAVKLEKKQKKFGAFVLFVLFHELKYNIIDVIYKKEEFKDLLFRHKELQKIFEEFSDIDRDSIVSKIISIIIEKLDIDFSEKDLIDLVDRAYKPDLSLQQKQFYKFILRKRNLETLFVLLY